MGRLPNLQQHDSPILCDLLTWKYSTNFNTHRAVFIKSTIYKSNACIALVCVCVCVTYLDVCKCMCAWVHASICKCSCLCVYMRVCFSKNQQGGECQLTGCIMGVCSSELSVSCRPVYAVIVSRRNSSCAKHLKDKTSLFMCDTFLHIWADRFGLVPDAVHHTSSLHTNPE